MADEDLTRTENKHMIQQSMQQLPTKGKEDQEHFDEAER